MKKNIYSSFLSFLFVSTALIAQENNKLKDGVAYQKNLKFENGTTTDAAISAFTKVYKLGKGNSFEVKKATTDKTGITHQRQQQFYKGIKVEFGMLITHTLNGKVVSVNGELYNAQGLNLTPALTNTKGLEKAIASTNAQKFLWEDDANAKAMDYKKPEGELVVFPIVKTGEVRLAYKYDVFASQPSFRDEIFVDAHTGQILYKNPIIKHATGFVSNKEMAEYTNSIGVLTTGSAATKYYGSKNIETIFNASTSKFVLYDDTRGGGIVTYNSAKTNTYPSTNFSDDDNNWTAAEFNNANKDDAALDAHWGAEMTYDFWKNTFDRNSYDDNGTLLKSYVHFDDVPGGGGMFNASWTGTSMRYGDGTTKPLTAIDICGHEIGHAICQYTAGLAYQNQSGAMNEGFSDIWGACIEHYGKTGSLNGPYPSSVWIIGEVINGGLRSMSNPEADGQSAGTYLNSNWIATADEGSCTPSGTTNDYCGVHTNSGVMNHWFYILTVGASGTNNGPDADVYSVTGIGMEKSSEIAYFAERDYLTANSTYADARIATLTAAGNLYCATSPEYIAVANAWYAVNVGEQFAANPDDVSLKSISSSSEACNTGIIPSINFENAGANPITSVDITYSIDGGVNINETWTGNLNACDIQNYPLTVGSLSRGTHTLSVTTTIVNDGVATNNTKTSNILVNDSGIVNDVNDFAVAADALISIDDSGLNTVWQRGTSTKTQLSNTVAGNSPVYATKLAGKYPDKTISYLVSQCYDLTYATNPVLKFDMAYDFETEWDILYMQYSTDGTTWNVLGTGTSPTWYTNSRLPNGTDCFNCIGGQWTGEGALANPRGDGINAKMRQYSYDLSAFGAGGTQQSNMIFRFVFHSDEAATEEGAIIDNFVVEGTLSNVENIFNTFAISPNPSKGTIVLSLSTDSNVKVSLFDISGRRIYNNTYSNSDIIFTQELKFNNLSKGIYLLNVESNGKKASKKLIIE